MNDFARYIGLPRLAAKQSKTDEYEIDLQRPGIQNQFLRSEALGAAGSVEMFVECMRSLMSVE